MQWTVRVRIAFVRPSVSPSRLYRYHKKESFRKAKINNVDNVPWYSKTILEVNRLVVKVTSP